MNSDYPQVLSDLKEKIRLARQRAALSVNAELLFIYWEIGQTILSQQKAQGWGAKVIDRLALDLKTKFPDMRGFSVRNMKYMRAFAEAYPGFAIGQPAVAQIRCGCACAWKGSGRAVPMPLGCGKTCL
jgi:hypothetical protein